MLKEVDNNQKIVIVDDDIIFLEDLKNKLLLNGYSNIICLNNIDDFIQYLTNLNDPDIIILDIFFGSENILRFKNSQISELLIDQNIIFITSSEDANIYEQTQDFENSYIIIKPFHFYTIDRLIQNLIKNQSKVVIKDGRKKHYIDKNEVICFEVNGNYSVLKTNLKQYVFKKSLKQIFNLYPNLDLVQIHRNFAVPKFKIQLINFREKYIIVDNVRLPLSYSFRENLE